MSIQHQHRSEPSTDPTNTAASSTTDPAVTETGDPTSPTPRPATTTADPTVALGPAEGRPTAAAVGPATFATDDRRRLRNLIDGLNAAFVDTS